MDLCDSKYNKTDNDLQNTETVKTKTTCESFSDRPITVAHNASEKRVSQVASSHSSPHAPTHADTAGASLSVTHKGTSEQAPVATAVPTQTQLTNRCEVSEALTHLQARVNNCSKSTTNLQDRDLCLEPCATDKSWANIVNDGEWKKVEYRKNTKSSNRFIGIQGKGSTIPNNTFKAADSKIYFYIYNVDMAASIKDIADYVLSKTQVVISPEKN